MSVEPVNQKTRWIHDVIGQPGGTPAHSCRGLTFRALHMQLMNPGQLLDEA